MGDDQAAPPSRRTVPITDIGAVREFFGTRAETWDERFPDDAPVFAVAVAALRLPVGGAVLDAGCGTARAVESSALGSG